MNIPFTVLELQQRPSLTNDLASMAGRRLVTSSETNESTRLNEARIKALTGGDPITARFLYSESFTYEPVAKFWLAVNHLPRVRDDSYGFWRRVRVLSFNEQFTGDDADKGLPFKLLEELPGILNWGVQGALNWRLVGLAPPSAVMTATLVQGARNPGAPQVGVPLLRHAHQGAIRRLRIFEWETLFSGDWIESQPVT